MKSGILKDGPLDVCSSYVREVHPIDLIDGLRVPQTSVGVGGKGPRALNGRAKWRAEVGKEGPDVCVGIPHARAELRRARGGGKNGPGGYLGGGMPEPVQRTAAVRLRRRGQQGSCPEEGLAPGRRADA